MEWSLVKRCCVLAECEQRSEEWIYGRVQKLPLESLSWTERVVGWEEPLSCCAAPDELVYAK